MARYPQACLELLPEELLQYLYAHITAPPCPLRWLVDLNEKKWSETAENNLSVAEEM